jgi:hypothetical protein
MGAVLGLVLLSVVLLIPLFILFSGPTPGSFDGAQPASAAGNVPAPNELIQVL